MPYSGDFGDPCIFDNRRSEFFSGMLQKPSRNLDTLIVLGAQVNGTKLSNSLKLRLERAKEYLDENPETIAVVSGGKGSGEEISEAEAMYEYLVSQGIDETRLIKENRSTNTNENLKYSLALLEEKSNKKPGNLRIGIVTNGFHVFRGTSIGKKDGMPTDRRCSGKKVTNFYS